MLGRTTLALILALLVVLPAVAQDFQKGLAAAKRGDYATALKEWRPLAEQGHAIAQYNLGLLYDNGRGVPQIHAEAARWYRKAAVQGNASAQNNLGFMYFTGQGVPQNHAEAVRWYRKAAVQGLAQAQNNLGAMYEMGRGVPQDQATAVKWYRNAAEQGNADVQNNLGSTYAKSQGVVTKAPPHGPLPRDSSSNISTAEVTLLAPTRAGFRVQLGAVKSKARAVKEAVRLSRAHKSVLDGMKIVLVRADLGKRGVFYRLRAGPLRNRTSADSLCRKLSARKQGCIVIKP